MMDKHLNLFYSYGAKDQQGNVKDALNEDNLTRAFIQTVRLLSKEHRRVFLGALFSRAQHLMYLDETHDGNEPTSIPPIDFSKADVALQDRIPSKYNPKYTSYGDDSRKRVVTISSGHRPKRQGGEKPKDSRPDAWIFDREGSSFCMLLECKYGDNPVEEYQIRRHGAEWFDKRVWKMEKECDWDTHIVPDLLDLTWYNVLEAIEATKKELEEESCVSPEASGRNDIEKTILDELAEYVGYYDYHLFLGFGLDKPWPVPTLAPLDGKEPKAMTDNPATVNFLYAFKRLQMFYDSLDLLCRRKIPERLKTKLMELGCGVVEEVDKNGKPSKASKLHWSSDVGHNSVYLPDPVFVRLKCDNRHILLAALLSPDRAPKEGPTLMIALLDSRHRGDPKLAELTDSIAERNLKKGEQDSDSRDCFFVQLDEFGADRIGSDGHRLNEVIDTRIAQPLYSLLKNADANP